MQEKLKKIINKSLDLLYENDKYLIDNNPDGNTKLDKLHHVGERTIVFRFAYYMQKMIEEDTDLSMHNFDCEYNRNGVNKKELPSFPDGVYPDIILHNRGNNDNNLLVIEVKTYWNNNTGKDEKKIKELMSKDGKYKFKHGVSLLIGKTREETIIKFLDN